MGGGGVMRAAFKAAGTGIQNAGIRGLPENFSVRRAVRPQASLSSSSATAIEEPSKLEIAASSQPAPVIAWELDDWDFAGYDVDDKNPRLVFGPAPSLDETKEATSELKQALDWMYFFPNSAGSSHSVSATDLHNLVSESSTPRGDTETFFLHQSSVVPSVSNHALQAFSLLRENAAAQTVVASIAADPNVWDAVLQNEALKEYLESERKSMESEEAQLNVSTDYSNTADAGNPGNFFTDLTQNVKHTVVEWVNNMSSFFHDLFGETDAKTSSANSWSPTSSSVCGTLFALASMVIMVVVLKRG